MYTMKQWKLDGSFKAEPGQEISAEIYEEMRDIMPPRSLSQETARNALKKYNIPVHEGFLMGEPHGTDSQGNKTYLAFGSNDYGKGARYYFLGLGTEPEPLHGTYYYFDCMTALKNDGLFPADYFKDDAEAIEKAADYEATLTKKEFDRGNIKGSILLYDPV